MGHGHGHGEGGHSHGPINFDDMSEEAGKKAQRITWIGMGANLGLCISKAAVGVYSGSASLVADAAHSISDMVSDVVALVAVKISRKPADELHPYGYGHYETFGTLGVSLLLVGAGVGSALYGLEHLRPLINGMPIEGVSMIPAAMGCAIMSVIIKEWLYQVTVRVGKETHSQVLIANAWHHRSDAFSSIVALLGIGGAALGFPVVDPIGAILVAGMIMKTGVEIGWDAVHNLVDAQTNQRLKDQVHEISDRLTEEGHIRQVSNVRCRRLGHYVLVDMHVTVDEYLSVTAASQARQRVVREIKQQLPEVAEVMIQVSAQPTTTPKTPPVDAKGERETTIQSEEGRSTLEGDGHGHSHAHADAAGVATASEGDMRTQTEIEADIRQVISELKGSSVKSGIQSVAHLSLHFVPVGVTEGDGEATGSTIIAEVSLNLDPGITVAAAKMAAILVRDEIVSNVKDVQEVDVHMELLHGLLDRESIHSHRHSDSNESLKF